MDKECKRLLVVDNGKCEILKSLAERYKGMTVQEFIEKYSEKDLIVG